jgi:hypothetical protein
MVWIQGLWLGSRGQDMAGSWRRGHVAPWCFELDTSSKRLAKALGFVWVFSVWWRIRDATTKDSKFSASFEANQALATAMMLGRINRKCRPEV